MFQSLGNALCDLGRRPAALVAILLLLNTIFSSYLGIIHDAQLYAGQTLHRFDPQLLDDDLFFRFGSQDRFSVFSALMAPLARLVGVRFAFLVTYVVFTALFFGAMTRLALRIWPDSSGAIVGLILLAISPTEYGGYGIFHLVEQFLSARLPACSLALWALANWLEGRGIRALAFVVAAMAIHPLMTTPVILVMMAATVRQRCGLTATLAIGGVIATLGAALFAIPSLTEQLFGTLDVHWRDLIVKAHPYQFPQMWRGRDWGWNLFALGGLALAASNMRNGRPSALLTAAVFVGVAGILGSWIVSNQPYATPIQAQLYRWLWLPICLMPPAVVDLANRAWQSNRLAERLGAIGLLAGLDASSFTWMTFQWLFASAPIFYGGRRAFVREESRGASTVWALVVSVIAGTILRATVQLIVYFGYFAAARDQMPFVQRLNAPFHFLERGVVLAVAISIVLGFHRLRGRAVAAALIAVGAQTGLFVLAESDFGQRRSPYFEERQFAERYFTAKQAERNRPLTIYCNANRLDWLWLNWRTQSYYDFAQVAGAVFNRPTALEGRRRAQLAAPFEIAHVLSSGTDTEDRKMRLMIWLGTPVDPDHSPHMRDVVRLAQDPELDYIALIDAHFPELAPDVAGALSIYDCRLLRTKR